MMLSTSFGSWLKQQRRQRGLTQETLGGLAGVSGSYLRKIEAGDRQPTRAVVDQLLEALRIPEMERDGIIETALGGSTVLSPQAYLPAPPTPLIGREREVAAITALLRRAETRLVTLTGPGGAGKTRLALEVAWELRDNFEDGAVFVDLGPVQDPMLVATTIAQTLQIREQGSRSAPDNLQDYLREKHLLLVLDNFEQVTRAAPMVSQLLSAAPKVKVLATSREVLHLRGEHDVVVPALAMPDLRALPDLEHLSQYEAVRLFVERAKAVKADFELTAENARAVAQICVRLDGLPLAIELAAARSRLFPPQVLVARLDQRLKLLTSETQDLPARQRTLRGAMEWSYGLLTEQEQTVFRRLGVFVEGWTLEAGEVVCRTGEDLDVDVARLMGSLMDKSLVQSAANSSADIRLILLDTIREFAWDKLVASNDAAAAQRRHAAYFRDLAERTEPSLQGSAMPEHMARLEVERENLRMALRWARDMGEVDTGLRLAGALYWYWRTKGELSEGRRWLEGMLSLSGSETRTTARAKALVGAGAMAQFQGDFTTAEVGLAESVAIYREMGDRAGLAFALYNLGQVLLAEHKPAEARAAAEESVVLFRAVKDEWRLALALQGLGLIAMAQADIDGAQRMEEESLALFRRHGDRWGVGLALSGLGRVAYAQGDYALAQQFFEEALTIRRAMGDKWLIAASLRLLADAVLQQGEADDAAYWYAEGLDLYRELGDRVGAVEVMEGLAGLLVRRGRAAQAVRLFAAAESLRNDTHAPLTPARRQERTGYLDRCQRDLTAEGFADAWAVGQAMPFEKAASYAADQVRNISAEGGP